MTIGDDVSLTLPPAAEAFMFCYTPTTPAKYCVSQYGCYILKDAQTNIVVTALCIQRPDFELCLRPGVVLHGQYAQCCYDRWYCNRIPDPSSKLFNNTCSVICQYETYLVSLYYIIRTAQLLGFCFPPPPSTPLHQPRLQVYLYTSILIHAVLYMQYYTQSPQ